MPRHGPGNRGAPPVQHKPLWPAAPCGREVCSPKGFAAFWRPPNDGESGICEQSFDQIVTTLRLDPNVLKSPQRECHQCIFACDGAAVDRVRWSLRRACKYGLCLVVINAGD